MPIYIAVEVARRELEARLLLGLVAAERGHDVVLGKIPHAALLRGELNGWRLPTGLLHLKSIAASPRVYSRFDALRDRGFRVSVQDEEHGLTDRDFGAWAVRRFPLDSRSRLDLVCAWGPTDGVWLEEHVANQFVRVAQTGAPRVDLWRQDVIGSCRSHDVEAGHILVVSSTTPFVVNPVWVQVANRRQGLFGPAFKGDDDPAEFAMYERHSQAYLFVSTLVRAVRRIARDHPDRTVVLRPHHFELPEAWVAALGDVLPNIQVRASGSARSWVRNAAVVIHGGSTVAFEASVAGRPLISFTPDGIMNDSIANRFGERADDVDALASRVGTILSDSCGVRPRDAELDQWLAALEGPLASDRIVDEWERMLTPATDGRVERIALRHGTVPDVRHPIRVVRDAVRDAFSRPTSRTATTRMDRGPFAMEVEHKFPSLDVDALREDARRLSEHLGRFKDVAIIQIGEREVLLRAAGR